MATIGTAANWTSILDAEERFLDPVVEFLPPTWYSTFYFRPDGMLVEQPTEFSLPIGECVATFTYGEAILSVRLNATGVWSSEEFYEE
jgi:hypothetical protein